MTSGGIVESLDVIEYICSGLVSCPICFAAARSVFSDEKKLSIAAADDAAVGHQPLELVYGANGAGEASSQFKQSRLRVYAARTVERKFATADFK